MTLTPAFLDELRARTSLSALVGKSVKLTRAGREHKGCCPFHQEKTPSFYVNDDKGFYHCFGCSAHGDAIRWMTDQRGLPFIDAVQELAQAAGLDIPAPDARAAEKQERAKGLHEACQAAADWFEQQLGGLDGGEAAALLRKRGVSDESRRRFKFGYAPDTRGKLRTALRDFGDATLIEAGLLIQVEGKEPYDRFRGRLTIPIRDSRGRVIAFGARAIGDAEPKYLNSPDTPLFDKGRTLFNLDRAVPAARKAGRLIVVEGYMDVIALAQAGIEEAVAPLGTALTEAQLERLWRVHDRPVLCFDGDSAGQKAAGRAAIRALPMLAPGRSLGFVTLPEGQDPDDLVRARGRGAIDALLGELQPLDDRLWANELSAAPLTTPEERASLGARLRSLAKQIVDPDVREQYLATWNRLVWDLFHPERPARSFTKSGKKVEPLRPIDARLLAISRHGIDQTTIIPALFKGLLHHPALIAPLAEVIVRVPVNAIRLRQTREAMLDAALRHRHLDHAQLMAILLQDGQRPVLERFKQVKIPFSFLLPSAGLEEAERDLVAILEKLAIGPELEREVAEAQAKLAEELDEPSFFELARSISAKREVDQAFQDALRAADERAEQFV